MSLKGTKTEKNLKDAAVISISHKKQILRAITMLQLFFVQQRKVKRVMLMDTWNS